MGTNIGTPTTECLPLADAFAALRVLSDQQLLTGLDSWRHSTGSGSLSSFDPELTALVQKQPPSKFGRSETPSLWTATHFYLALPSLSYALAKYGKEDDTTRALIIHADDITRYFVGFPYLVRHYREYRQLVKHFGSPSEAWWNRILQGSFDGAPKDASAAILLEYLPDYLREQAARVLSDQTDTLSGRIVLAYLLNQGTGADDLPFDERSERYLAPMHGAAPNKTLFERLVAAQLEFAELDTYLERYDEEQSLRLDALLGLVQWYARPHLVEMIIPGLTGAAEPTIRGIQALFAQIIKDGGPDYTAPPLEALPSVQRFYATQSVHAIGRLSIVKDILTHASNAGESDGVVLRRLASRLYGEAERRTAWGNTEYYIPNANREPEINTFRQDIADIIYCAGLFAENDNMSGRVEPEALKQLGERLLRARTFKGMRTTIQANRRILNELVIDWEVRYAGHERLRLLRFVRQTFGLDAIAPIPIPLSEISKGFAGSYYDGHVYHLRYQEAGEKLSMAITVNTNQEATKQVQYRTISAQEKPRLTHEGLPYSAWLEVTQSRNTKQAVIIPVPGRGSFDPFGRVGSPHAGEVIGFGCSVHHASLAIILAELASLGASCGDLEQVASAFMRINQTVHERYDLAAFQLAQIIAAFEDGTLYSYTDYLQARLDIIFDQSRPHLAAYARIGKKSLAWAEPQAARLSFAYPTLYPSRSRPTINPRQSWYDGNAVELPDAAVSWCVLTC